MALINYQNLGEATAAEGVHQASVDPLPHQAAEGVEVRLYHCYTPETPFLLCVDLARGQCIQCLSDNPV